jgi:pyrroloquinoline quinone (PQQ) biosynthesis protein C
MMNDYSGYGHGMMGGFGGNGMMGWNGEEGPMHDDMIASLADALGLPAAEIEARHDAGETLWEIAEAEGLSAEEIQELMFSAHNIALEEAVDNGWLTQEQAEWMDGHMEKMWEGGSHCGGSGYFGTGG